MATSIWWIRRDLRLTENHALSFALSHSDKVIPLFILDPVLTNSHYVGKKRLAFLYDGLRSLDADLRHRNSQLIVKQGKPLSVLSEIARETQPRWIIAEEDHTPYAKTRDSNISKILPLHLVSGVTIASPGNILKANGEPYIVYTPFSRKWKNEILSSLGDMTPAPSHIPSVHNLGSLPIPKGPIPPTNVDFIPGEKQAQLRLEDFISRRNDSIYDYDMGRNLVGQMGTSRLSPYLRFGMLSAKQAVAKALCVLKSVDEMEEQKGADIWLNELIWREFYIHIMHHFPRVRGSSFRAVYDDIEWDNDTETFTAWCEGRTGYPIIDAAMRQLVKSGWMHNRNRMIVASFLVKDLLIDWKWGERFFMQHLIDGDPAANNGGWQWVAGTGTDASPYFRIFNPVLQGKKYDPQGIYVKSWLPELQKVPQKYIHNPWLMPKSVQLESNCVIGKHYTQPIVDHGAARSKTLAAYAKARSTANNR